MKVSYIVGPGIKLDTSQIKKSYKNNQKTLEVYNKDGLELDCDKLNFKNNSQVFINAHGSSDSLKHAMRLCSPFFSSTNDQLKKIANKKVIAFELISCKGGAAISSIKALPAGSSLITFVRNGYETLLPIDTEIRTNPILISESNPFIRFVYFILTNPETNKFAFKTKSDERIFISSIDDLTFYSELEIKKWQRKQLNEYLKFCTKLASTLPENVQISKVLKILEDEQEISNLIDMFAVSRFRELWLINMAGQNNLNGIESLVASGVNQSTQLISSENVIWAAANSGNLEVMKFFRDVPIGIANKDGATPLYMAASAGHKDVVKYLLSRGADVKPTDFDGMNAFAIACYKGYLDIVKLIHSKAYQNKNIPNAEGIDSANSNGDTPMYLAAKEGKTDVVEFLISKGANVNAASKMGDNALFPSTFNGHIETIRALIQAKINLDLQTNDHMNPLMMSCFANKPNISKLLLASGVNTEVVVERGKKIVDLCPSTQIQKEIKIFNKSPVTYILKNNNYVDSALAALQRLEKLSHIKNKPAVVAEIARVEECLGAQNEGFELSLNQICGENGSYWSSSDL